eukprot:2257704-Prymnesium_polylepis.1
MAGGQTGQLSRKGSRKRRPRRPRPRATPGRRRRRTRERARRPRGLPTGAGWHAEGGDATPFSAHVVWAGRWHTDSSPGKRSARSGSLPEISG